MPSGRWQASYVGPDLVRRTAPVTFDSQMDAEAWLAARYREVVSDEWQPPVRKEAVTLSVFAERWLTYRELKPRTRDQYQRLLEREILPTLGVMPLKRITADAVEDWHASLPPGRKTYNAHAYSLLRTILKDAEQRRLIDHNPCHIRGAGTTKRAKVIEPATVAELAALVEALPERYRALALLAGWCQLRFGELIGLRRMDIDLDRAVVRVRQGVTRIPGEVIVGTPKSHKGTRDVSIPAGILPVIQAHLEGIADDPDALVFPSTTDPTKYLGYTTLRRHFEKAREVAGRPDLTPHALRHTGATLAAQEGATLAELMDRLGHSNVAAAMRYQHAAQGRGAELAEKLNKRLHGG